MAKKVWVATSGTDGFEKTLYTPKEKAERFRAQIKSGVVAETGKKLTAEQVAYGKAYWRRIGNRWTSTITSKRRTPASLKSTKRTRRLFGQTEEKTTAAIKPETVGRARSEGFGRAEGGVNVAKRKRYSYAERKAYWQGFGYALGAEGKYPNVFGRSLLNPDAIAQSAMNGQSAAIENKKKERR